MLRKGDAKVGKQMGSNPVPTLFTICTFLDKMHKLLCLFLFHLNIKVIRISLSWISCTIDVIIITY